MSDDNVYSYLNGKRLQPWYRVAIREIHLAEKDYYHTPGTTQLVTSRKVVLFHSRIHETKVSSPTIGWAGTFTDAQILKDNDLLGWVSRKFGDVFASK